MNTNQLLSFLVLAETGSYQRTAERLHYNRSTVLEQIHSLEKELGVNLFCKEGRRLRTTTAGDQFFLHAQSMMRAYQNALTETIEPTNNETLRIVTGETLGLYFLSVPFQRLIVRFPRIDLSISFRSDRSASDYIRNGEADIVVCFMEDLWNTPAGNGVVRTLLCKDEAVFFSSPDASFAKKDDRQLKDLSDANFILTKRGGVYSRHLATIYETTGLKIAPRQHLDSGSLVREVVKQLDCVSMLSRRVIAEDLADGRLVEHPLYPQPFMTDVVALYSEKDTEKPVLKEFLRIAKSYLH